MATSRDCSKMVAFICLQFVNSTNHQLSGRAEKVEIKQKNSTKYADYQIANIHNPEVRFFFCNREWNGISKFYIKIQRNNVCTDSLSYIVDSWPIS
ncbi:unnamed protein product [Meloidogyne enterolobii]|uniref:Uncharacterized protein n=1 Tax=Meloidogyne enterolobii TaxID=390850 RepID=A0ACB1AN02_MELEN